MVALRKDVKVGLTIGAIAVSVIGVYAGLSALAGEKPAGDGATLVTTPIDLAAKQNTKPAVETIRTPTQTITPPPTQIAKGPDGAAVQPNQPLTVPPTGDTSNDPWGVAFGSGTLPPTVTQQPTPGTKTETANDQKQTIEALQGKPAIANADGSGSLATGTTPPTLVNGINNNGGATPPAAPTGPEKSHTVEPGETFSSISSEYYGDPNQFNAIIAANPQVNPNKLKPGTVIKIPALAAKSPRSDAGEVPATGTGSATSTFDATKQYVVKPGDSLHRIASHLYNDSAVSTKLYELNKAAIGTDPTRIKVGMVLTLPSPPTALAKK